MPAKRVLVSFTPEQWRIIESQKGQMGRTDASVVRTIVLTWLMEKELIGPAKPKRKGGGD